MPFLFYYMTNHLHLDTKTTTFFPPYHFMANGNTWNGTWHAPCLMYRSLEQMLPIVTRTIASVGSMSVGFGLFTN